MAPGFRRSGSTVVPNPPANIARVCRTFACYLTENKSATETYLDRQFGLAAIEPVRMRRAA
jgi:hypothetical protein